MAAQHVHDDDATHAVPDKMQTRRVQTIALHRVKQPIGIVVQMLQYRVVRINRRLHPRLAHRVSPVQTGITRHPQTVY